MSARNNKRTRARKIWKIFLFFFHGEVLFVKIARSSTTLFRKKKSSTTIKNCDNDLRPYEYVWPRIFYVRLTHYVKVRRKKLINKKKKKRTKRKLHVFFYFCKCNCQSHRTHYSDYNIIFR